MGVAKTALRPCPICSEKNVETLHTQRFILPEDSPLPASYDVVACPECGFVYGDTAVGQTGYDRYYAQFSKYEDPRVATGGGSSDHDRRRLADLADHLAARVDRSARVLDLGCAAGGLLSALRDRGFSRLHGTDAAEACVSQVRAVGIHATCLPLSELRSLGTEMPFDLVVASHVFEHVVDLRALTAAVKSLTAPGGLVYIETPNAAGYAENPHVPFYFFDSEHINHFDTTRLAALGRSVGLTPDSEGTKSLQIADDKNYPACWIWLRNAPAGEIPSPPSSDQSLKTAVAAYIEGCRAKAQFPALRDLAATGRPIIVWGAGSLAQRLFGDGALAGCNVVAIADRDRNKQGRSFAGLTVDRPEDAIARHPEAAILVAAAIEEARITAEIRALGTKRDIFTLTGSGAGTAASESPAGNG